MTNRVTHPRIAVLATANFPLSHADAFLSRWFETWGNDREYAWEKPQSRIPSLYWHRLGP